MEKQTTGVVILGMHRSGTSAIARCIQALGFHLGANLLETRFDNPTGYWEDKAIVELQECVLRTLGMTWENSNLIDDDWWESAEALLFAAELRAYITEHLLQGENWAFKDPRTVRLLPMWKNVMQGLPCEVRYLLVIRNPISVATSLYRRQGFPAADAYRLWLAYLVPYLDRLFARGLVVVDYDLFMERPLEQIQRIARALDISESESVSARIVNYLQTFLRDDLWHNRTDRRALADSVEVPHACKRAYLWLRQWAVSNPAADLADGRGEWAQVVLETRMLLERDSE